LFRWGGFVGIKIYIGRIVYSFNLGSGNGAGVIFNKLSIAVTRDFSILIELFTKFQDLFVRSNNIIRVNDCLFNVTWILRSMILEIN